MTILTAIVWMTASAPAAKLKSHEVVVRLLEQPEPDPYGRTHGSTAFHGFPHIRPRGAVDEVVTDGGKLKLSCGVRGRALAVGVAYDTGNYPEHLPEEMGCVIGNVDLTVRFVGVPPLYRDASEVQAGPDRPAEWRKRAGEYATGSRGFGLPSDRTWLEGEVQALGEAGQAWRGVRCRVQQVPEGPLLHVDVDDGRLPDGAGRCPLATEEGTVDVPVVVRTM